MHEELTDERSGLRSDPTPPAVLPENAVAAATWSRGGDHYDRISRQIAEAIEHCVDRLDPRPGERVLDVATGTGWTARRVAERGARVTGIDFGAGVIEAAKRRHPDGEYRVADAEQLPFPDGSFDAVVSTFGVMFCADSRRAAAELARVCKPGGRLVLSTWTKASLVREMFELIRSHAPAAPQAPPPRPAPPSPFLWGDTGHVVDLLADHFDLGFEEAVCYYREPDGASAFEAFAQGFGPVVTLLQKLDGAARERFRVEFEAFHERFRTGVGILLPREYLVTVGRRHR